MRAKLVAAQIEADMKVFMVNPRRIKAFRDAEGLRAKTDKLDASLIARFAHAMAHELRPPADPRQAVLKALSTGRRQLTESIAIEKTRLKQAFDPLVLESFAASLGLTPRQEGTGGSDRSRSAAAAICAGCWPVAPPR